MEIYREEKREGLFDFLEKDSHVEGRRRRILAAPPLFVMPEELLKELLGKNQMEKASAPEFLKYMPGSVNGWKPYWLTARFRMSCPR